jgi:circadian clock protein KaiB
MPNYVFRLFVMGQSPRSQRAVANLRRLCEERLRGKYEVDVIDVLEHPRSAEEARILATPTLVKERPPPERRVIGDLSEPDKVLTGLGVVCAHSDMPSFEARRK